MKINRLTSIALAACLVGGYWSPLRGSQQIYLPGNPSLAEHRLGLNYVRCFAGSDLKRAWFPKARKASRLGLSYDRCFAARLYVSEADAPARSLQAVHGQFLLS
jgi:hypothetical protein